MLKTWQVSNFKSIREMGEPLEFAPLTIFCGTNSSGKSSLLQSILLFKQTLEKKEIQGPRMALNGGLVKLGNFNEILTDGLSEDNDKKIKCAFQIDNPTTGFTETLRKIYDKMDDYTPLEAGKEEMIGKLDFQSFIDEKKEDSKHYKKILEELYLTGNIANLSPDTQKYLEENSIKFPEIAKPPVGCCVCFGSPIDGDSELTNNLGIDLRYPRITSINITENIVGSQKNKRLIGCKYIEDFSEYPVSEVYLLDGEDVCFKPIYWVKNIPLNGNEKDKDRKIEEFYKKENDHLTANDEAFDNFFPKLDFFDNEDLPAYDEDSLADAVLAKTHYEYAKNNIVDFFSNGLHYVGPLRADPRESNDTTSQYKGVGYRGEYTSECFTLHSNLKSFPPIFGPDTADDDYDRIFLEKLRDLIEKKPMGEISFKPSVYEWLKYIGVADEVNTDDKGELVVKQGNGKWSSLKNVGVGVSQVLPIIVQCIIAEPGSTIIIEQPELHLHPKMQSRLADFFLVMSLLGKQIIIETHSEYIIDKLRLRIAQAPSDVPINDKVAVYFAEKKNDNSEFRRIHINEYSVMSEWPEGFFEDSMQIAREIMLAAEEKKLKNSSTTGEEDDDDY